MAHQFLFSPYILDNLPVPAFGFDVVRDTLNTNLRMYITSRGVKSFFVRKRINGADTRIIIGKYPDISIDDARAQVANVLNATQIPPQKKSSKASFKKIADLYLIKKVRRTHESKIKLARAIQLHLSELFEKNITDITKTDITNVLSKIKGNAISNRMYELLHSIFNFAQAYGYIQLNPICDIPKRSEQRRIRPLSAAGMERLLRVIKKEKSPHIRAAFLMLVYGFETRGKIFSMRWRDLDFNNYIWNGAPMSDAAVVLLQNLPQNNKWVFPGQNDGHLIDPRMTWKRIAIRAKIPNLTMDDVHKFMIRQLGWSSDREVLRRNMNDLIIKIDV